jgi:hypothetical protein
MFGVLRRQLTVEQNIGNSRQAPLFLSLTHSVMQNFSSCAAADLGARGGVDNARRVHYCFLSFMPCRRASSAHTNTLIDNERRALHGKMRVNSFTVPLHFCIIIMQESRVPLLLLPSVCVCTLI